MTIDGRGRKAFRKSFWWAAIAVVLCFGLLPPPGFADAGITWAGRPAAGLTSGMTVETIVARSENGRVLGTLVVPSIIRPATARDERPLLVVFNGGPGAASAWLQLGLLGPLRIRSADSPANLQAQLEPNPHGLWDAADILFLDPLGTGFSRAAAGVAPAEIRDWRKDGDYLAGAIRGWMERHGRTRAPVVLVGESYGTERAVAVAEALDRPGDRPRDRAGVGIRLAGMVLISQTVLNEFALDQEDRPLGVAIGLPTIAATACYYRQAAGQAADSPAACADRAFGFAMAEYRQALSGAGGMTAARRNAIVARLSDLTGLPADRFAGDGIGMNRNRYRLTALADRKMVLGMYDSRLAAPSDPRNGWRDPSLFPLLAMMDSAVREYNRATIGLERSPLDGGRYIVFDPAIHAGWQYDRETAPVGANGMADRLGLILRRTGARLLVAGGMFDTVGSYGADRYLLSQLALPSGQAGLRSYPGGHMFYLDRSSRDAFLAELRHFLDADGLWRTDRGGTMSMLGERARPVS